MPDSASKVVWQLLTRKESFSSRKSSTIPMKKFSCLIWPTKYTHRLKEEYNNCKESPIKANLFP